VLLHLGVDKDYATKRAPWSAEKDSFASVLSSQSTVVKNKPGRLLLAETHVSSDVSLPLAVNDAILKHSSSCSKDEIDVPFDVAVFVKLPARLGV
jgi:hypothetical protein